MSANCFRVGDGQKKSRGASKKSARLEDEFEKLISAAYFTRSIDKRLKAYSESGDSDSYNDPDANKRAKVEKFARRSNEHDTGEANRL